MIHETLYKKDSTGRLRIWVLESYGNKYRTISGLYPYANTASGWTECIGKRGLSDEGQCAFEVASKYKHQLDREYRRTIEELDTVGDAFFEPMLAKTYAGFPGPGYTQPKLDGIRCIARAEGLFTRQGQPILGAPHIHEALAPLFEQDPDLIFDGELYNHDFRDDFGEIVSIVRKKNPTAAQLAKSKELMQYHVYDLPSEGSEEFYTRGLVLVDLFRKLEDASPHHNCIVPVPTYKALTQADSDAQYAMYLEAGYEGGMFRLDAPYEQKRSKNLLKRKEFMTREYPIIAIEEGNGNWAGAAKRFILRNDDGKPFGAGVRGKYADLKLLLKEPILETAVATVRYFMLSPDGVPRFPVVIDYHLEGRVD